MPEKPVTPMRMFQMYNWGYTIRCVFAPDIPTAKRVASAAGHVRGEKFRRIAEVTLDTEGLTERQVAALEEAMSRGACGMAEYDDEAGRWIIEVYKD